ncbi:MAG: hypothetical protein QOC62_5180, partial [Mycobacterium sp.]|nr:hypothetical protein [Mycobacterium sp.]
QGGPHVCLMLFAQALIARPAFPKAGHTSA